MTKAAIYARYSSERQNESSISAQVRACREYAAKKGLTIPDDDVYADEAISGRGEKTAARVQYQKLLRECEKKKYDIVFIHKYDRVSRNLSEHVNLEKRLHDKGIELVAVAQDFGGGSESKIIKALLWSLSEFYSDNLASETAKGHREVALRGLHNGGVAPFGYDVIDQRYVINELEAGYVRKIFEAATSRQGFTAIIKEMESSGIKGKRSKPIKYTQIYEMLRNEKYTGTYTYSPQEAAKRADRRTKPDAIKIENALPVIIDRARFEEVQRIMNERKQTGKKAGYLCSGLVYCSCGAKMHGSSPERKGHVYRSYRCSSKCGFGTVRMEAVDAAAIEYLRELLSDENQTKISTALREYQSDDGTRVEAFKGALKKKMTEKQRQYDALMANLSTGALPAEVTADVGQRMKALKDEMDVLRNAEPPKDYTTDYIKSWLDALKSTPDEKAIHLLIERIDVKNKTDFNITSTLKSVLLENGCGGRI